MDDTLGFKFSYNMPGQKETLPITSTDELMESIHKAY